MPHTACTLRAIKGQCPPPPLPPPLPPPEGHLSCRPLVSLQRRQGLLLQHGAVPAVRPRGGCSAPKPIGHRWRPCFPLLPPPPSALSHVTCTACRHMPFRLVPSCVCLVCRWWLWPTCCRKHRRRMIWIATCTRRRVVDVGSAPLLSACYTTPQGSARNLTSDGRILTE